MVSEAERIGAVANYVAARRDQKTRTAVSHLEFHQNILVTFKSQIACSLLPCHFWPIVVSSVVFDLVKPVEKIIFRNNN